MYDDLDQILADATHPDPYADHETHLYTLYTLIERLTTEVKRLQKELA